MRLSKLARQLTCLSSCLLFLTLTLLFFRTILHTNQMRYKLLVFFPKSSSRIVLTNMSHIFLDLHKTATFYTSDKILVMTFLTQTHSKRTKKFDVRLTVKDRSSNHLVVLDEYPVNVFETMLCSNEFYVFSSFKMSLNLPVNRTTRLTYQLSVNELITEELDINVVDHTSMTPDRAPPLAARLIKCMWSPKDTRYLEFVMKLIVESRYDSIYVCVFQQDVKLIDLLEKLNKTVHSSIHIIELADLPHYASSKPFYLDYNELRYDSRIERENGILDPAVEFLLNQVYPQLVAKYRYVQAGDYDHILFDPERGKSNRSFYDRVEAIVKREKIEPSHASIYLNQYWALDNPTAIKIIDFIRRETILSNSSSVSVMRNIYFFVHAQKRVIRILFKPKLLFEF